jgi:hypothetical protein
LQVRFALSSQVTFQAGGSNGNWPLRSFYRKIVSVGDLMPEDDLKELLGWWDEYVLTFCSVDCF